MLDQINLQIIHFLLLLYRTIFFQIFQQQVFFLRKKILFEPNITFLLKACDFYHILNICGSVLYAFMNNAYISKVINPLFGLYKDNCFGSNYRNIFVIIIPNISVSFFN